MQLADGFDYEPAPRSIPFDAIDREVLALARLWNRSEHESRAEFLEMARESGGGIIDP